MLIGNLHAATPPIEERFGVAIGSGPLLLGDLRKLTAAQQDWYATRIRWFKKLRSNPVTLFCSAIVVLIGMWLERYVIIVSSLAQDFLPSSWSIFQATRWDWMTYIGTIGLFLFLFFLFIRLLPMISIFEVRTLLPEAKVEDEVEG